MPEGDALHRAARRFQVLVGERVAVETPNPRAAGSRLAERLDGRRLEAAEAVGKNLLLTFEGGLVLRSHLRMTGRWQVRPRDSRAQAGSPWLVLRSAEHEEALWHARLSPWLPLGEASGVELERALGESARLMRSSLENGRPRRSVYRRPGRPCPRCGEPICSRGQGDANRIAYWCPGCQRGEG